MTQPLDDDARRRRHRTERIVATLFVLALVAGVVAFVRWNAAEEEAFQKNRVYIPPPPKITPEVELLQRYVRIDTSQKNEIVGARFLAAILANNGVRAEIIESEPGRASLYARIPGRQPGQGLLLLNHIDVVAADSSKWNEPPFEGKLRLATLFGRGVLDMKGVAVCQLAAFLDVARSGRPPEHDLVFLAVADEENGGKLGTGWLIEHRPELFAGIRYAIGEGGITEMIADRLTYFGIEIGAKQYARVTVAADSLEVLQQVRFRLEPYFSSSEPERILPEVKEYFHAIAPTRTSIPRQLEDVDATVARGEFWLLPKPYRDLTQNVLSMHWPYKTDRGWAANVFLLLLPDEDPAARVAWVRGLVEPLGVRMTVDVLEPRTPLSTSATPLFAIIASEASRLYKVRAGTLVLHRSTSDSRYLRRLGIDAYGLSPYPVDAFQSATIHGTDEQIRIDRFSDGVELMRAIVRKWAAGT